MYVIISISILEETFVDWSNESNLMFIWNKTS